METQYTVWDVDSTLTGESLDELARTKLSEEQYQDFAIITKLGMNGEIPFSESLQRRINIIVEARVTVSDLENFAKTIEVAVGVREHIQKLIQENPEQHIVLTGGFRRILLPLLLSIGFVEENVFTNIFTDDGEVITGHDENNLLAQDNGKVQQMTRIMSVDEFTHLNPVANGTSVVGDGGSDKKILTSGLAKTFVHFTGIAGKQNRENIAKDVDDHKDMFASEDHEDTVRILRERQQLPLAAK
ncbi:MAG: haloacid dehalogenase-like hydrolase [Candidatus Gracilibacteria bacterium]|nr:haloacid dehalogenase-like hydrolase [Candidatus Gracilibacteria bacterium]